MLNTVTCWSNNIIIFSTFLSMMKGLTPSGAFGFYCSICFVGWLFIVFFYPDVNVCRLNPYARYSGMDLVLDTTNNGSERTKIPKNLCSNLSVTEAGKVPVCFP